MKIKKTHKIEKILTLFDDLLEEGSIYSINKLQKRYKLKLENYKEIKKFLGYESIKVGRNIKRRKKIIIKDRKNLDDYLETKINLYIKMTGVNLGIIESYKKRGFFIKHI